ncbi:MAG TPA: serine/threonine-protein kinase [Polyangiaceae bacterium]|nr:serine/threonine-protein kinase [Polyangiaceae bacterium]
MLSVPAEDAFSTLSNALVGQPELEEAVRDRWRIRLRSSASTQHDIVLPEALRTAADLLSRELPLQTHNAADIAALGQRFATPGGALLLLWCYASTWRKDIELAKLLGIARSVPGFEERVATVAADRVIEGPLLDALLCAPLLGTGAALRLPNNAEARARLEILIWEAGASAREVPEFGRWLWASNDTFEELIRNPARGALRGRVLAARCLEIGVCGLSAHADQELVGRALQTLQPLLLHPEPLVWVHAARALGRLTGQVEQLEGTLLDWVLGESTLLRQRALTAFASLPAARLKFLASQLVAILESPSEADWALGAVAVATPYLFFERRPLWDRLAARILAGDGGSVAARALARGLSVIWRRGQRLPEIEAPLRALRELAWCARPVSLDESRRWIEVTALTDAVDGAERDPLDLELGLENLMRVAAQYDDEEADSRAARFATSLASTFGEARRIALGEGGRLRQRAAAINALEGCARAFALRLWGPMLATRPVGEPIEEPHLEETWKLVARAPAEILDLVKERRQIEGCEPDADLPLEVLAIRLGGYALDACGESTDLGPGRGPTAHDTCHWLRKISGLADGSRELQPQLKAALSALFWRLVDTTRGTALGEVDDVEWLGPFAAWWALVIDRPAMLLQLATALPMMADGALARCCERAELLRTAVSSGGGDGEWGAAASDALESLHALNTELSRALLGLSDALLSFDGAAGPKPDLEVMCLDLVRAGERLQGALADPVKALHEARAHDEEGHSLVPMSRNAAENAQRIAALVARAIRARELSLLDVWFASLGPVASALLEGAVRSAIRRTPPPPPKPKKQEPKIIHGYELVKTLGEGGIGSVWLVRKPGADRLFVLKIPKAEALANATDSERDGILASFVEEARALAGLYHPNVANIIDRGVESGMPFLVLEYLIGADLKEYAAAQQMSLFELRQVVLDSCAGLAALHSAGLVHRDIKPANIWLRLPLSGGERFDPNKHRDPARAQPLSAVVIDFGMVRAIRVPADASGRFVAGTAGYIAPEQVLDPVELDPRSDVYSLAGTIYNVTTGRAFFDEIDSARDRIIAHMRRDPLEDAERLKPFPVAIAKLLRAATLLDPAHRPTPLEFGKEFASAL